MATRLTAIACVLVLASPLRRAARDRVKNVHLIFPIALHSHGEIFALSEQSGSKHERTRIKEHLVMAAKSKSTSTE
jgi:hypothetical protein